MDGGDFSVLVARLERQADDDPTTYSFQVGCIAALGYLFIGVTILAVLFAAYLCVMSIADGHVYRWAVIGLLAGLGTLFALVRALIVHIEPPSGRAITREEAPALFALLDEVRSRMSIEHRGKRELIPIATVTLDNEFNASICQVPRWGVFGGYSNHLTLGVPLLATLDVAELKTVLAHEVGHLGGQHGRFAAWIYRQRQTWSALQEKFAEPKNVVDQMLATFYRWYVPYFNAYTFVLARRHEYEADHRAAWATDARVLGRALIKVDLAARFLGEIYWDRFYAQIEKSPQPQYLPYSTMPKALTMAQQQWLRKDWLEIALRRFAGETETHPGLGERLAALDVTAELPSYAFDKSALTLFGPQAMALLKWCDQEWKTENASAWRKRHDAIKEARWKIAEYSKTPPHELKPSDMWEKALLLLDIGEQRVAVDELRALVTLDPSVAKAQFLLGRLLLEAGDETGLNNLALAAQRDEEMLPVAGQLGYGYLMDRGRKGEAQRFWDKCQAA